jgi:sec-independent protein translocase protein TatC
VPRVKPVDFEDRLTLVEHLDELRTRIITTLVVFAVFAGICFWQNNFLLDLANDPLPPQYDEPLTIGVAEPFMTTLTVTAYAALILTLPVLLYELYAFVLPALSPRERKTILPFLLLAPVLFIGGVVFAYFVVMPAATDFLLNFNEDQFNTELRARDYYSFFALTSVAVGILFQIPIGILAITRLGIFTPQQIAANRRYAILIIAVLAMLLPGTDPITMVISMVPLVFLFEGSLLLARIIGPPKDLQEPELDPEPQPERREPPTAPPGEPA